MDLTLPPVVPARCRWQGLTPFSETYGDSYFMPGQGMAESRAVFIDANELAQRFAALNRDSLFVIGETGFGSGLNCLLAARCFLDNAPAGAALHLLSAELHPLERPDLRRVLEQWPELGPLSKRLVEQYPPAAPGMHRVKLHEHVDLTLMQGDALTLWRHCQASVDAWFLDGFAPARNGRMWTAELFRVVADRSRPGATAATFTAAGSVRRGLESVGFRVQRHNGFAGKRHRLTAAWPGNWEAQSLRRGHVLVAGAGLAGATSARALAERGWRVTVIDPRLNQTGPPPDSLAGVIYTTASDHLRAQNRFYQASLIHTLNRLHQLGFPRSAAEGRLDGVVQHLIDERSTRRAKRALESGAWPDEMLEQVGEHRVVFRGAGYLHPPTWCRFLLDHPNIETRNGSIADCRVPVTLSNREKLEADALVVCIAGAAGALPGLEWLPLRIVRGQVTFCRATQASLRWHRPQCHAGYLTPALNDTHCVGATFDRNRQEAEIHSADDRINLETLKRHLPDHWQALGGPDIEIVGHHAGLRCQSPDTLPMCGPLPDPTDGPHTLATDVFLNIAHGSRGLVQTPLCADLVADTLSGRPHPVDTSMNAMLAPERFVLRWRRRNPRWIP